VITLIECDIDYGQRGSRRMMNFYVGGVITRDQAAEWVRVKCGWSRVNAAAFRVTAIELETQYDLVVAEGHGI
jgi:hypothetical protein